MEAKQKGKVPMNKKPHGQLTAETALHLSQYLVNRGYDVLFDHGDSSNENVGRIVSWFGDELNREAQLSFLDIAVVEHNSQKVFVLVEIEKTTDKPKTLLADVFDTLMGDHITFREKRKLRVGDWTILIVMGKSDVLHQERNSFLRRKANSIRPALGTANASIKEVVIETFPNESELERMLKEQIDCALKKK
jgi:hypothetical protein